MNFTIVYMDRWHFQPVRISPACRVDVIAPIADATDEEKWFQDNRVHSFHPTVVRAPVTGEVTEEEKEEFVPDTHRKRENNKRQLRAKNNICRMTEFASNNTGRYYEADGTLNITACHADMTGWKDWYRHRYSWFDESRI